MKVFIFLPDGVGLRNFAFTNFYNLGKQLGNNIVFWNNTKFLLNEELGINEIPVLKPKTHPLSDLYKRAKIIVELKQSYKKTKKEAFLNYIFPSSYKGVKNLVKSICVDVLVFFNNSETGIEKLRSKILKLERKTAYYRSAIEQLKSESPDIVFCTNQRAVIAVAPLLAARDLKIPTVSFIYSWDNLPKATLVVETDYYFVWSSFMKDELLKYYPRIKEAQIKITGTPQFEPHFDTTLIKTREDFFNENKLDYNKEYICFSGDDVTTSPNDEYYLEDLAIVIEKMNLNGSNIGILFRKCPVDFSGRYDAIVKKYDEIIVAVNPLWENKANGWNAVMPTKADVALLVNTSKHCKLVFNVASSMVFDFAIHNNACAYLNYKTEKLNNNNWSSQTVYDFIHFESMPSNKAVNWINKKEDLEVLLMKMLNKKTSYHNAQDWFKIINDYPENSSKKIWEMINLITVDRCI